MESAAAAPAPQQSQWQTFQEEEEAPLLLSHPPTTAKTSTHDDVDDDDDDDFEFCVSAGGGLFLPAAVDMCAADEVFFNGRILPLRWPSVGSAPSRCGSRSSDDSTTLGGLDTSRSNSSSSSSRRSSACVTRCHSSGSTHSVSAPDAPRLPPPPSLSNNFYTHPSPKPQLRGGGGGCSGARLWPRTAGGRRSASSAPTGWGIFRLGLVRAPQIEMHDLRSRRQGTASGGRKSDADDANSSKIARSNDGSTSKRFGSCGNEDQGDKKVGRLVGRGLSCKGSLDAVVEPSTWPMRKKQEAGDRSLRRVSSMGRSRIFEWLEELTIAKAAPPANRDGGGGGSH